MVTNTAQRTKFLTREQRLNIKRGKTNSTTTTQQDPFKVRTRNLTAQQRINLEQQKKNVEIQVQQVNKNLQEGNYSTLKQAQQQYNSLPQFIKQKITLTPQKSFDIQVNKLITKINALNKNIESSRESRSKAKKKDNQSRADKEKARQRGYQAEINEISKILKDVKSKGIFIDTNKALSFAYDVGKQVRKNKQAKLENKRANEKAQKTIVTKTTQKELTALDKTIAQNLLNQLSKTGKVANAQQQKQLDKFVSKDVQKQAILFNTKVDQIKKGKAPVFNDLFRSGLTANQANKIISDYNRGGAIKVYENLDTTKYFKFINENSNLGLDKTANIQAFKIAVNQEFKKTKNFKPLKFSEDIKKFDSQYNKLLKAREKTIKQLKNLKPLQTKTFKSLQSIQNKVLTGQSVSPSELQKYQDSFKSKSLKQQSIALRDVLKNLGIKTLKLTPIVYGMNLKRRFDNGELNPFLKDIKYYSKGIKIGIVDPIVWIAGKIIKSGEYTLNAFWDYGTKLGKSQSSHKVIANDIKKILDNIAGGIQATGKASRKLNDFINKNPRLAAIIAAAAVVEGGVKFAKFIGKTEKQMQKAYRDNPPQFLGELTAFFLGDIAIAKALAAASKSRKLSPYYVKVDEFIGATPQQLGSAKGLQKEFGKTTKGYSISRSKISDLFDNKGYLKIDSALGGADRVYYWAESLVPDLEFTLGGQAKYRGAVIKGKTKDVVNKQIEKIIQKNTGLNNSQIKKLITKYSEDHFYFGNDKVYSYYAKPRKGGAGETLLLVENSNPLKYPKKIRDKIKNIDSLSNSEKIKLRKDINSLIKKNPGKFAPSPRTFGKGFGEFESVVPVGTNIKRINNLRTKSYDLIGLKKGTKFTFLEQADIFIEIAEGTLKKNLDTKTLKELLKEFGAKLRKKYSIKKMKSDLLNWLKENFTKKGKAIKTQKIKELTKKEKDFIKKQIDSIRKDKTLTRTQRDTNIRRWTKARKQNKVFRKISSVVRKSTRKKITTKRKITSRKKSVPRKKITTKRKITTKKLPIVRGKATPPPIRKPTLKKPPVKPPIRKPIIRKPPVRPPIRKPLPPSKLSTKKKPAPVKPIPHKKLNFDSDKLKNKVLTFIGTFRERRFPKKSAGKSNPIVTKTIRIKDTKNRALKRVAQRVDNTLTASLQLKVIGIGKGKKDIGKPKVLKKFKVKKTIKSPTLKLVEKNKSRFDTKGEIKEAQAQKRIKKKGSPQKKTNNGKSKKKTSSKKKKVVKKKSSKKKSLKRKKK